jgi:orotate phosphoribosyltransferase
MDRQKLKELILKVSYREGNFTLASGKKSDFYIDLKPTTLHPDGAYALGRLAVEKIIEAGIPIDAVGGMTLGADPIGTAVSLAAREKGLQWPAFIVRKEPKDHGTSRYVEGTENLRPGARLLVVEDVVTTGGSSLKAIEHLRNAGYVPAAVLTLVDREQGGKEAFEKAGVPLLSLFSIKEIRSK